MPRLRNGLSKGLMDIKRLELEIIQKVSTPSFGWDELTLSRSDGGRQRWSGSKN
jgi:hypothetical protein